jgi:N-acetyl-anhydromuramyl-L-alanine amidase AmpD
LTDLLIWLVLVTAWMRPPLISGADLDPRDWARAHLPVGRNCPPALLTARDEPPRLIDHMLPYRQWEREYRSYFQLHYHESSLTFRPTLIVMHYTVSSSAEATRNGFVRGARMWDGDRGTVFGHPSVQLMIAENGDVWQLLPLDRRATGSYGVDRQALSIEMVAMSERDLLSRPAQVLASFRLVSWLSRVYAIPPNKIYGHIDVSLGRWWIDEYLDYSDSHDPFGYPKSSARLDPGRTYLRWLRQFLRLRQG